MMFTVLYSRLLRIIKTIKNDKKNAWKRKKNDRRA